MKVTAENASLRLLELRKKHKLTQIELAEKTELSRFTITSIENGKTTPNNFTLFKLNSFFELLEGNGKQ
jgi:DNA-binding XRE family transcriptional regulator